MALKEYHVLNPDLKTDIADLKGDTKELSTKVYDLVSRIDEDKLMLSRAYLDTSKDFFRILLKPSTEMLLGFRIDIFNGFYDFFIDEEEIFIQQKINPIEKSFKIIYSHLKSTVEEVLVCDKGENLKRNKINFYIRNNKIDAIGNFPLISSWFKNKRKKILKYEAWITG